MPSIEQFVALGMNSARFKPHPGQVDLIQNMVVTGDGTLKSVTGPTLYEPTEVWGTAVLNSILSKVHAGWHGYLDGGKKEVLLVHAGKKILCHWGSIRGWVALNLPRTVHDDSERNSQFIAMNNGVIFCDGFGPPLFITSQLDVLTLGFPDVPSAPVVRGPESEDQSRSAESGEGFHGYSWHGNLGTPGDRLNGEKAHILNSEYAYRIQLESFQGDLSAMSLSAATISYGPKKSKAVIRSSGNIALSDILFSPGQTIRDLQRGAAVILSDNLPDNAKFIRVLRTKDTRRNENDFYVAWKVPVGGGAVHDWRADGGLTLKAQDIIPVPSFSAATLYGGGLAIIDGPRVRLSEPNFPGTYKRSSWVSITAEGRQGTAIFSLGGRLYAATDTTIVDCSDFSSPRTVSNNIGVASQNAFAYVPGTGIVFIARQGVFSMNTTTEGVPVVQKISNDIDYLWRTDINKTRLDNAVVWFSEEHSEVRIALSRKGEAENTIIYAMGAGGWRTFDFGMEINCQFNIDDMEAIGGNDNRTGLPQGRSSNDVYVLERETQVYTPPPRNTVYESDWQTLDGELGVVRGQVLSLMLCFAETSAELVGQVDVYLNYENGPKETLQWYLNDVTGSDVIDNPTRRAEWANTVNGTDVWEQRRVFWRTWKVALRDVQRFKYKITVPYPSEVELISALHTFEVPAKVTHREPEAQDR